MLKTINGVGSLLMGEAMKLPNGLTEEVKVALDHAMDLICSTLVANKYGVTVECNPNGDRNLIKIDGQLMNHYEFNNWIMEKEAEANAPKQDTNINPETGEVLEETPVTYSQGMTIPVISFDGHLTDRVVRREVKYCTGYFVAADSNHTSEYDEENNLTIVHNVTLGRKASASELVRIESWR